MSPALNLNRLAYFVAVVDTSSFTRAAEQLGVTKAVVSQHIARLEQDVGTTLLVRTTRRLQPTEAGRRFHGRCAVILHEAEDAFAELAQARAEPTGTLRLTAPYDYGVAVVVPLVSAFSACYPACRVELKLSDQMLDLVSGQMDMAIRVGWLSDSSQQARRIGTFQQLLVGRSDPSLSAVTLPTDLAAAPFVANTALRDPLSWTFMRGEEQHTVRMQAAIAIDTTQAVHEAVRAGSGLSVLPDYLVGGDVHDGRLVHMLPDWELPSGGIHVVFPAARYRPPKVTAFVEMLAQAERARTRDKEVADTYSGAMRQILPPASSPT